MGACKDCGCKDGDRGPMGLPGVKGDDGIAGNIGNTGPQGAQGIQGLVGAQGIQGLTGPQGADGNNDSGPAGPTGANGITGAQGIQGNDGVPGIDGIDGANGQACCLTYSIDSISGNHTESPVANTGIIMMNTGGLATIQLPTGLLGDQIQIVGTYTSSGWRLLTAGTDQIQLSYTPPLECQPGGYVEPVASNFGDCITIISDGLGNWIIRDKVFFNGNNPYFS